VTISDEQLKRLGATFHISTPANPTAVAMEVQRRQNMLGV